MKQFTKRLIFVLITTMVLSSGQLFAEQKNANLDWSKFNGLSLCAITPMGVLAAKTQEYKVKKILKKQEVTFDVGKIADFHIDGQVVPLSNCAPLPISQVSNGTTSRCFARMQEQRFYIYLQRIVNHVTGAQQQAVTVMTDDGDPMPLVVGNCL